MRKIYLSVSLLLVVFCVRAAIFNVAVGDFYFNPSNVNANCGDTIHWFWESGTHSTTSDAIPACATSWTHDITATSTTFDYVLPLTCSGTYNYHCRFHTMMVGTITVSCAIGVGEINGVGSSIFPNPFSEKITVTAKGVNRVVLYDVLGNEVRNSVAEPGESTITLDVVDLPRGIYFIRLYKADAVLTTKRMNKI